VVLRNGLLAAGYRVQKGSVADDPRGVRIDHRNCEERIGCMARLQGPVGSAVRGSHNGSESAHRRGGARVQGGDGVEVIRRGARLEFPAGTSISRAQDSSTRPHHPSIVDVHEGEPAQPYAGAELICPAVAAVGGVQNTIAVCYPPDIGLHEGDSHVGNGYNVVVQSPGRAIRAPDKSKSVINVAYGPNLSSGGGERQDSVCVVRIYVMLHEWSAPSRAAIRGDRGCARALAGGRSGRAAQPSGVGILKQERRQTLHSRRGWRRGPASTAVARSHQR